MNIQSLLIQYLNNNKKLSIPGIGTFTLNEENPLHIDDKSKTPNPEIKFDNYSINQLDESLIEFIQKQTGKMRPLAISDIESFITLSTQLLNIGKPLHLEGLGTLSKNSIGELSFTPGRMQLERVEYQKPDFKEHHLERDYSTKVNRTNPARRWITILIILSSAAIIYTGTRYLLNLESGKRQETLKTEGTFLDLDSVNKAIDNPLTDSTTQLSQNGPDSTSLKPDSTQPFNETPTTVNNKKFIILNTSNKERALKRYNQLLYLKHKVQLDSSQPESIKVYFLIPTPDSDTLKIKDSLRRFFNAKVEIIN